MRAGELFFQYVGVRGILSLLLVGVYAYLNAVGLQATDAFENVMLIVLGSYMTQNGQKLLAAYKNAKAAEKMEG